jgi:hypothetical protein
MTAIFQVFTDANNRTISLTNSHLLFVKNSGYINAAKVNIGDVLRVYSYETNELADFKVKQISFEIKRGFIAPLTNEGTILVNQVDASCFAEINNHQFANIAMKPVKMWYKLSKYFGAQTATSQNVNTNFYSNLLYTFASNYMSSFLK